MLFHEAEATVCTTNGKSDPFPIKRRVRQGCPLVPYLFLLIGEVLNLAKKHVIAVDELTGVILPKEVDELSIIQYADNMNAMLGASESNFRTITKLIEKFGLASGLHIN